MSGAYDHNWHKVRKQVLERDGHRCQLGLPGCTSSARHVDHIVPLAEGGARLDPDNLRASCQSCNLRRTAGRQAALIQAFEAGHTAQPSRRW